MKEKALALKREIRHLELELKNTESPARRKSLEQVIAMADALLLKIIWSN